ncbi:hypothetical protein DPMN_137760 [Dreissena polymorpha]|uniref:Uncharacterized protein n=1 Tax=Dreissena polymorpha TaxID=45954 RepID=A0A9D4G5V5_DREPO|nr:hypothetical protein DPMN_137760 [Dreissena polymorpha]
MREHDGDNSIIRPRQATLRWRQCDSTMETIRQCDNTMTTVRQYDGDSVKYDDENTTMR